MARVLFLGTPGYAVPALQALIARHTVVAVVTQPDRYTGRGRRALVKPPVKVVAEAHGLAVYQPERLSRDAATLASLAEARPEVGVLAAYGQILRSQVLALPPRGIIGLHASLLARWRGAAPVAAAIRAGDDQTGVTLMLTEAGLDTGPLLARRAIPIREDDTTETLTERLAMLAAELLIEQLPAWLRGEITPIPQDDSQATYAPEAQKDEGRIDWTQSAEAIGRHIRAMTPWPGAFTAWGDQRITILKAQPLPEASHQQTPGCIVETDQGLAVATGQGLLLLFSIQPAGKRPMSPDAFVCGRPGCVGSALS